MAAALPSGILYFTLFCFFMVTANFYQRNRGTAARQPQPARLRARGLGGFLLRVDVERSHRNCGSVDRILGAGQSGQRPGGGGLRLDVLQVADSERGVRVSGGAVVRVLLGAGQDAAGGADQHRDLSGQHSARLADDFRPLGVSPVGNFRRRAGDQHQRGARLSGNRGDVFWRSTSGSIRPGGCGRFTRNSSSSC